MANLVNLQLGKNGLTPDFMKNLKVIFGNKGTESVRVSVLRHATRDKKEMEEWASKIIAELGDKFTYKIIGYTIVLRKWRKARVVK